MTMHDRATAGWEWFRRFLDRNLAVLIVVAAIVGPAYVATTFERQRLAIICDTYHVEWAAYQRDRAIATELGIPIRFRPPMVPEVCR